LLLMLLIKKTNRIIDNREIIKFEQDLNDKLNASLSNIGIKYNMRHVVCVSHKHLKHYYFTHFVTGKFGKCLLAGLISLYLDYHRGQQ